jgi:hypothetical protein
MKIGILIPTTSHGRPWVSYKETYLYNIMLKSFLLTYDKTYTDSNAQMAMVHKLMAPIEHEYIFYIGMDKGDKVLDSHETKNNINKLSTVFKNIKFQYLYMTDVTKGHLTVMWNRLFTRALGDQCDYFYQCGDDIEFKSKGWVNDCIKTLKANNDYGMTGPINNNPNILTQTFVSRKHYELFGYFFPPEIINWCCDDWINHVYRNLNAFFPLKQHFCENIGGRPRYVINNDATFCTDDHVAFVRNTQKLREECQQIVQRDLQRLAAKKLVN